MVEAPSVIPASRRRCVEGKKAGDGKGGGGVGAIMKPYWISSAPSTYYSSLYRVNEIVPPNFLINSQTHGVESSCGHRQRLQCSLPGDMNIKEGSCSELSGDSLLGGKLQRETDVLRMALCHFSQLSFNTLIYRHSWGRGGGGGEQGFIWESVFAGCIVFKSPSLKNIQGCLLDSNQTNHNHPSAPTQSGTAALDDGTFITGRKEDNRERKEGFFFSNTFPFIGMVRLMRIAHKK